MAYNSNNLRTQNELLMKNLMDFYKNDTIENTNFTKMMNVVNGESNISLRIIDWFVTNYAKKNFVIYNVSHSEDAITRFKVYNDYKLKLKAYSKKNFDPFCRWERVTVPYEGDRYIETTIGQLNFFKWAIENKIVEYIQQNYATIESDMNLHNSTSKKQQSLDVNGNHMKTRKKREELSVSAVKCVRKENIKITVVFS